MASCSQAGSASTGVTDCESSFGVVAELMLLKAPKAGDVGGGSLLAVNCMSVCRRDEPAPLDGDG